jgi:hypothetical protein
MSKIVKDGKHVAPAVSQRRKTSVSKKTPIDRFNDNRQSETDRLSLKRKMEHDEKMASIHLKRRKYELRFGSTSTPRSSGSPAPSESTEDKQIQILRLQIRLAELTGGSRSAMAFPSHHTPLTPSTPSSTYTGYADNYTAAAPPVASGSSYNTDNYTTAAPAAATNSSATANSCDAIEIYRATENYGGHGMGGSGWDSEFKFMGEST